MRTSAPAITAITLVLRRRPDIGVAVPGKKAFWDKPNPKKKSSPLSASQKKAAKARAAKAGRPYPNLVDNAWAKGKK